jgi:pyruvate kinase
MIETQGASMRIDASGLALPAGAQSWTPIDQLAGELSRLHGEMSRIEEAFRDRIARLDPAWRASARNLLDYLTLRRFDLRPLQDALAERGLSSLGRAEAHVRSTIEAVLDLLELSGAPARNRAAPRAANGGRKLLEKHADALLGRARETRNTRIMVTLDSDAANDLELVRTLLEGGMEIARINCAHDDEATWERMIANVRREAEGRGTRCRILMDLAGPKLRTGAVRSGPEVLKIRPVRDEAGRVTAPATIRLSPVGRAPAPSRSVDATLHLPGPWLARCTVDDEIRFEDARGSERVLTVRSVSGSGCLASLSKTAYVATGTLFERKGAHGDHDVAAVGCLPPLPGFIRLERGDHLVLTKDQSPGVPARVDETGVVIAPARIPCTLPEVFGDVRAGEAIWLDDGSIQGVVRSATPEEVLVEVLATRALGRKLRSEKGINLPDSELRLPALTAQDLQVLPFVARNADLVGLSFVHEPADVALLRRKLGELQGDAAPGIVLKIETRRAFDRLPDLLFAGMEGPRLGVMIARGDLAIESGYERLAEVQEEILWICEAAHVPAIWATQVLEGLAKDGIPSRAEITDAAMGRRAECVMLNKGPHVVDAVRALDDILGRMQHHQYKKRSMLRKLHLAEHALGA